MLFSQPRRRSENLPYGSMSASVKLEEVNQRILRHDDQPGASYKHGQLTTEAAKEPFSHLRL